MALTIKNAMVYDYMRKKIDTVPQTSVKAVYLANKDEIAREFGINGYQQFNFHIRKCLDWETSTGKKVNVIRMDNEEVQHNGQTNT